MKNLINFWPTRAPFLPCTGNISRMKISKFGEFRNYLTREKSWSAEFHHGKMPLLVLGFKPTAFRLLVDVVPSLRYLASYCLTELGPNWLPASTMGTLQRILASYSGQGQAFPWPLLPVANAINELQA